MRWIFLALSVLGIAAASFALREHYRTDSSPCSINERWDCGIVNHSPYAMLGVIPVAAIGIAGYLFLAALAFRRAYTLLLLSSLAALAYSLYLAHIERDLLGVWCVYCVASLCIISLITLLSLITVAVKKLSRSRSLPTPP